MSRTEATLTTAAKFWNEMILKHFRRRDDRPGYEIDWNEIGEALVKALLGAEDRGRQQRIEEEAQPKGERGMTTHYILLTATKIIQPDPTRLGGMVQAVLNSKHRKLIPATCVFTEEQTTGAAVAEMGTHAIVFEESFDTVARALEAFQPGKTMGEHMAERAKAERSWLHKRIPNQFGTDADRAAQRAASGARHQGELSAEEELGQILQEAKEKLENSGVQLKDGDLRLNCSATGDRPWFVQIRRMDEDRTFEWTRTGLPSELTAGFSSAEAASEAVKLAGYGRRLIDE